MCRRCGKNNGFGRRPWSPSMSLKRFPAGVSPTPDRLTLPRTRHALQVRPVETPCPRGCLTNVSVHHQCVDRGRSLCSFSKLLSRCRALRPRIVALATRSPHPPPPTFRVDRMRPKLPVGPRFSPREIPDGDAAAHVARGVAQLWPYRATVRLHIPANSEQARTAATYGTIEHTVAAWRSVPTPRRH